MEFSSGLKIIHSTFISLVAFLKLLKKKFSPVNSLSTQYVFAPPEKKKKFRELDKTILK